MKKNQFVIHLSEDTAVDLDLMTKKDWDVIKNDTKYLMQKGIIKEPAKAYIASFITYLKSLEPLTEPYDSKKHKFI